MAMGLRTRDQCLHPGPSLPWAPPPCRFPHGVRPVFGTHDPCEARLVLHGEQLGNQSAACLACRLSTGQITQNTARNARLLRSESLWLRLLQGVT